jgi:Fe-S cluster biogenesis protein NfuA/nitrite reductase/ring-hydroxylating ferredoxin subunit
MVSAVTGEARTDGAPQDPKLKAMADRVEALLASFDTVATPRQAREQADDLARTIVALYGAGLERVLTIVYDALGAERADAVFALLVQDKFVESLLCLHGLHPVAVEDRVQRALDSVRPYLQSHEGGIDIVSIDDGVVLLRLEGSCKGCPSSTMTVKLAVERAILEQVPEIHAVRAEGIGDGPGAMRTEWLSLGKVPRLETHGLATADVGGASVLLVSLDGALYAYRNRCAACGATFDGAALDGRSVACPACGRSYDVVHAGRSAAEDGAFIEPLPLARETWRVRITIPAGA